MNKLVCYILDIDEIGIFGYAEKEKRNFVLL